MELRTEIFNFRVIGTLIILLGFFSQSNAQIIFHSIDELFVYADNNAIVLKSADLNEQFYKSKNEESKTELLPDINATFGYNDNIALQPSLLPAQIFDPSAPEGQFTEITFGTKFQYSQNLQVQWDVLNFQKIFGVEVSNLNLQKTKANTELNRFNLYNQLASTYYSIVLTQEAIKIYEDNALASSIIAENALNQFKKGIISETDYKQALINKKQIDAELKSYQNNLEQYYVQLQIHLNTKDRVNVKDSFEEFNLISSNDFKIHPQLLVQETNLLAVEAELKQTRGVRQPNISLFYQQSTNWATDDFFSFSDANELPQQVFGITMTIPLVNFSNKKKIEQSKINLEIQKLEFENSKLEIQKEDELLELQLKQGLTRYGDDQQILALQRENDKHYENLYANGIISLDSRLEKYKELLNSQNNYLNSLANLTLSKYKKYIRQIDFESN